MRLHQYWLLGGLSDSKSGALHLGTRPGFERPPPQDPTWRVPRLVSALNFFYLSRAYFLRALYCISTCRNSKLSLGWHWLKRTCWRAVDRRSWEMSLAPARRMKSSSVKGAGCHYGQPALRFTFCFVSVAALERLSVLLCPC